MFSAPAPCSEPRHPLSEALVFNLDENIEAGGSWKSNRLACSVQASPGTLALRVEDGFFGVLNG